jgi:competence protein ComGC
VGAGRPRPDQERLGVHELLGPERWIAGLSCSRPHQLPDRAVAVYLGLLWIIGRRARRGLAKNWLNTSPGRSSASAMSGQSADELKPMAALSAPEPGDPGKKAAARGRYPIAIDLVLINVLAIWFIQSNPGFSPAVPAILATLIGLFWREFALKKLPIVAGSTLTMCVIIVTIIFMNNCKRARNNANIRACYANQKTLAGALEMYNLDKNTKRTDMGLSFCQALVSGGYLRSIPNDPGQGGIATVADYQFTSSPNNIKCKIHGGIQ